MRISVLIRVFFIYGKQFSDMTGIPQKESVPVYQNEQKDNVLAWMKRCLLISPLY